MLSVIIIGFVMMTLGVALLFLGEVPFVAGRRISAVRSRIIGAILVLFLPLSLAVLLALNLIFGRGVIEGPIVTWSMFTLSWLAICVVMFRVLVPKNTRKVQAKVAKKDAPAKTPTPRIEDNALTWIESEAEPPKPPPAKKAAKKPANENPFDFS